MARLRLLTRRPAARLPRPMQRPHALQLVLCDPLGEKTRPVVHVSYRARRRAVDQRVCDAPDAASRARPSPILRPIDQFRPNRVELDISHGEAQMSVVQGAGVEPALPQVALPAVSTIDDPRISLVRFGQSRTETTLIGRQEDQVDVVRHQAPRQHIDSGSAAAFPYQLDISRVVRRLEERLLTPVATLGDMVGYSWDNGAGCAGHEQPWHRTEIKARTKSVRWRAARGRAMRK